MGRILFVDLEKGDFRELQLPEEFYRDFAGGIGLAARILIDEIPAGADPLGPDNLLAFMSGALTGTGALMTGRWMVACKSPLTGGWGEANCGGTLSPAIKRCGYDGIIFRGLSPSPVLFFCDDAGPRLKSAQDLWGKDAIETEEELAVRYAGKIKPAIATIGYAAEKLSLISGISNDGGRYAARSGVGAVMGSKHLKALVLAGSKKISCADPAQVAALSKKFASKAGKANLPSFIKGKHLAFAGAMIGMPLVVRINGLMGTAFFRRWGTIYNNTGGVVNGDTPIGNWALGPSSFPKGKREKLNPDGVIARETKKYRCYSCAIGCGGICDMGDFTSKGGHTHKPEYETHAAFGPLLLNDDLSSIFRCNDICNRSGLDTISAGSTIAFALECKERKAIPADLLGDIKLAWGDSASIEDFLGLMARREGVGALFADGTREAAKRLGIADAEYAVHAGGQEPGMHDPRLDPHLGVAFSADPTPGRHTISAGLYYNLICLWKEVSWAPAVPLAYPRSREAAATEEEALKSVAGSLYKQVADMAGGCLFAMLTGIDTWNLFSFFNAATGWSLSPDDYMEMGRRSQTLRQLFNIKQGIDPRANMIPARLCGDPPLSDGPLKGKHFPLAEKVALHWKAMGWNQATGIPEAETLARLGLEDLVTKQFPKGL
jgi:aldehyde:ferredoxin oxidoreductase